MRTGVSPATFPRSIPLSRLGKRLNPFPLVQLPYHRLLNPWILGAVLHEISHNLQSDLGLSRALPRSVALRQLRGGIDRSVAMIWTRWNREVFADMSALLLGGPQIVGSLMDVIGHGPATVLTFNAGGVSGKSAPDNRWDSSRAAGNTPAKRPGCRHLGSARLARPASCPAICGIEKGDGRIKRLCRWAPRQHSMDNPEKNRVAKTVVDRLCSFQEALGGTKRKYPTQEFLSFPEAARSYIDLTRHDQLIHTEMSPTPYTA